MVFPYLTCSWNDVYAEKQYSYSTEAVKKMNFICHLSLPLAVVVIGPVFPVPTPATAQQAVSGT